ncbi:hypothetical protein, partial [Mesorhizobium sp.]|uniref:hypothetical protein n=1 Tax=Mesorhizobium sp. TaxID=1871066 RepID=UPI0025EF502E
RRVLEGIRVVRTAPMWEGHPADSNHEVVPCGPRIYTLKLYQTLLQALLYLLFSKVYAKVAI